MTFSLFADDDKPTKTITIPVKIEKGRVRMRDGSQLPRMIEGAYCVMVLPEEAVIVDAPEAEIEFCAAGTELLVGVRYDKVPPELQKHLYSGDKAEWSDATARLSDFNDSERIVVRNLSFVPIQLKEPLKLELSAATSGTFREATCYISSLEKEAISLNQAYTFISERFEEYRQAHTGNVFDRVYIKTAHGWDNLDVERARLNAEYEQQCKQRGKPGLR